MANNFKIAMHRNGCNLQLSLAGDFDGSSAFELYNVLKENLDSAGHVFINIENLKKIYPFGLKVFNHNFSKLRNHRGRIDFIGKNSDPIRSTAIYV
jgi:anti-anti-sigma regulatory factor